MEASAELELHSAYAPAKEGERSMACKRSGVRAPPSPLRWCCWDFPWHGSCRIASYRAWPASVKRSLAEPLRKQARRIFGGPGAIWPVSSPPAGGHRAKPPNARRRVAGGRRPPAEPRIPLISLRIRDSRSFAPTVGSPTASRAPARGAPDRSSQARLKGRPKRTTRSSQLTRCPGSFSGNGDPSDERAHRPRIQVQASLHSCTKPSRYGAWSKSEPQPRDGQSLTCLTRRSRAFPPREMRRISSSPISCWRIAFWTSRKSVMGLPSTSMRRSPPRTPPSAS